MYEIKMIKLKQINRLVVDYYLNQEKGFLKLDLLRKVKKKDENWNFKEEIKEQVLIVDVKDEVWKEILEKIESGYRQIVETYVL